MNLALPPRRETFLPNQQAKEWYYRIVATFWRMIIFHSHLLNVNRVVTLKRAFGRAIPMAFMRSLHPTLSWLSREDGRRKGTHPGVGLAALPAFKDPALHDKAGFRFGH